MKKIVAVCAVISLFVTQGAFAAAPPEGFAEIVDKLMPAVVNISTTQKTTPKTPAAPGEPLPKFPKGSPFEEFNEFFERFGNPGLENEEGRKAISLGSGFVIDPSGYIVTNNHVIAEAEEITVNFSDDIQLKAKLIGSDTKTDLALLKIDAKKPLPFVKFGNSDKTRVGDWVVAIGNPFGLGGTVTAGIISARARDINAGPFDDFLQTDASINKGNSGGPMFNMAGEVIGINTAIYSPSGGSVGIGFATPSSLAQPVINMLREGKKIRRGWLGVKIQGITEDIAESLGLAEDKGALVVDVTKGSPADKAGIVTGDIILKFDGKEIAAMRKLPRIVAETPVGKKVTVDLLRKDSKKTVTVALGELNEKEEAQAAVSSEKTGTAVPSKEMLGMSLSALTPELRSTYNIGADVKGVVITAITKGSEAALRGLQPGDVLIGINHELLSTTDKVTALVAQAKKEGRKSVLLLINRAGTTQFVPLPVEAKEKKEKK
jgi:serine protease Do